MQFGTIEKRKAFEDYWARLNERPAYKRGVELDNAAMPQKA
jgi:glutathione S-transferase